MLLKKTFVVFLCVLLFISFHQMPSLAESSVKSPIISVSNNTVCVGDTFKVNVSIDENPGIMAMTFTLCYDNNIFVYESFSIGVLNDYTIVDHPDRGYVSFTSAESKNKFDNGILFSIEFSVKDDAQIGNYNFKIKHIRPETYGSSMQGCFADWQASTFSPIINNGITAVVLPQEDFVWSLEGEDTLLISGVGDTPNYKYVYDTPWYVFSNLITKVIVSNGIQRVGNKCFESLINLKEVYIENANLSFGYFVFPEQTEAVIYCENDSYVEEYAYLNNISVNIPPVPTIEKREENNITLEYVDGYEYSMDGVHWQSSASFTVLPYNTVISFYQRDTSLATDGIVSTSKAKRCIIASTPDVFKGETSLKIIPNELYEYSVDGLNWQESNYFNRLIPYETYMVYQRPKTLLNVDSFYDNNGIEIVLDGKENDGVYEIADIVYLQKILLNDTGRKELCADINCDYIINILDLIKLKKIIAGI